MAKPIKPPPSRTSRPGSGKTEDRTTVGAAKEFVATTRTSRITGPKFRTEENSFHPKHSQAVLQPVDIHNEFKEQLSGAKSRLAAWGIMTFCTVSLLAVCKALHRFAIGPPFAALGAGFGPIRRFGKIG